MHYIEASWVTKTNNDGTSETLAPFKGEMWISNPMCVVTPIKDLPTGKAGRRQQG